MLVMFSRSIHRLPPLAALAALLAFATPVADASTLTTVVGNLALADGGSTTASFNSFSVRYAQGFSTAASPQFADNDGNGYVSAQVLWHLHAGEGWDANIELAPALTGFSLQLHADNGGVPGSVISGPFSETTEQNGVVVFSIGDAVSPLQPNTNYWLTLGFYRPSGSSLVIPPSLSTTTNTASTGSGAFGSLLVSDDNGSSWGGTSERAILEVNIEAVPEPSAWALAAAGIALAVTRRRKRRQPHDPSRSR